MENQPDYNPSMLQQIFGTGMGLVFLLLSIQVLFPGIQMPIISIIPGALSMVDFVIHEVGHLVFNNAGVFIGILGGTLAQLFIPIVCSFLSYQKKQWISFSCFQFWFGQSLMQISNYIGDARSRDLKLFSPGSVFGGVDPIHDWNYLLSKTGLLWADQILAGMVFILGLCVLVVSFSLMFVWGIRNRKINSI